VEGAGSLPQPVRGSELDLYLTADHQPDFVHRNVNEIAVRMPENEHVDVSDGATPLLTLPTRRPGTEDVDGVDAIDLCESGPQPPWHAKRSHQEPLHRFEVGARGIGPNEAGLPYSARGDDPGMLRSLDLPMYRGGWDAQPPGQVRKRLLPFGIIEDVCQDLDLLPGPEDRQQLGRSSSFHDLEYIF